MSDTTEMLEAWISERPPAVQEKIRAYPPTQFYRVIPTGQHCRIDSYSEGEDGSCETCRITAWYPDGPLIADITRIGVFGMPFSDLEPLSPQPSEPPRP